MALVILGDRIGNRAAIKIIVHRAQLFVAVAARCALCFYHAEYRAPEFLLFQHVADLRRLAAGQIHPRVVRPARELLGDVFNIAREQWINGETVARDFHRRGRRLLERNRAVAAQRFDMRRGRCRHDRAQQTFGHVLAIALGNQSIDVGRRGPVTEPGQTDDAVFFGEIDERRGDAREAHHVGLQHRECHRGSDAGVDRVAAAVEYAHGRRRREIVTGRHRIMIAGNRGPETRRLHRHFDFAFHACTPCLLQVRSSIESPRTRSSR